MHHWCSVVVAAPAHSAIAGALTYRSPSVLAPGALVRVPLGKREVLGVVWKTLPDSGELDEAQAREITGALEGLPALAPTWRKLISFTAAYYQRSPGEVALAALPPQLRELSGLQLARRLKRAVVDSSHTASVQPPALSAGQAAALQEFSSDKRPALLFGATGSGKTEVYLRAAADVLQKDPAAQVLVMVPEINLTPQLQARFQQRFGHLGKERVVSMHSGLSPAQRLKSWLAAHSGEARLILGTRMAVLASLPRLRLIVVDEEHDPSYKQQEGARYSARDLAVYRAKLETDEAGPDGGCRVLLGSATPSLESWQATLSGRYQRLTMNERIGAAAPPDGLDERPAGPPQASSAPPGGSTPHEAGAHGDGTSKPGPRDWLSQTAGAAAPPGGRELHAVSDRGGGILKPGPRDWLSQTAGAAPPPGGREPHAVGERGGLPSVRRVDMNHQPKHCVISPPLLDAIRQRIERGEQSLVFLNRRGYAPVLACHDCDWKSECPNCSAYRVFHKIDRTLRCHHCGFTERVPRACPVCGNIDIAPVGRGTERLEEHLAELLADAKRPDSASAQWPKGEPVRIARIDADTTRLKGALESQLASVHSGEIDVLVGTQMIAKGHDFRHITLVAAINPDSALFSSDFRAPERLFSLLMQAAGRAGRDARHSQASEMWVQTFHPGHPLFAALKAHDYPAFAAQQLAERQAANLSPFGFTALLRGEARTQEVAQGFLNAAAAHPGFLQAHPQVMAYPAVPMTIQRVANVERAQMLVESTSRAALQRFLSAWQPLLFETRRQGDFKSLIRWAIDVDPIAI
jgi:primosomal protein N' (replication factor Y)